MSVKMEVQTWKVIKKPRYEPTNSHGLTAGEGEVLASLLDAHEKFQKLKGQHPSEYTDWVNGVHTLQKILASRAVRRAFPLGWAIYEKVNDKPKRARRTPVPKARSRRRK